MKPVVRCTEGNYPKPEDIGWSHDDRNEREWDYCQCEAPLKSEKEQRDGVCRECL